MGASGRGRGAAGSATSSTDHIAAELAPLGLVPDGPAFERVFVDTVLATHPDPMQAWNLFYGNTMRRLRRPDPGGTGSVATFARIYAHVMSLIRGTTVLDVGCCFGFLPLLAADRDPRLRVIGTDLVPSAVALAGRISRAQGSRARFAAADLLALPVAEPGGGHGPGGPRPGASPGRGVRPGPRAVAPRRPAPGGDRRAAGRGAGSHLRARPGLRPAQAGQDSAPARRPGRRPCTPPTAGGWCWTGDPPPRRYCPIG